MLSAICHHYVCSYIQFYYETYPQEQYIEDLYGKYSLGNASDDIIPGKYFHFTDMNNNYEEYSDFGTFFTIKELDLTSNTTFIYQEINYTPETCSNKNQIVKTFKGSWVHDHSDNFFLYTDSQIYLPDEIENSIQLKLENGKMKIGNITDKSFELLDDDSGWEVYYLVSE